MKIFLHRLQKHEDRTLGRLLVFDGLSLVGNFTTLELPFKNNERNVSCILTGFYHVTPRCAEKFGSHFLVEGPQNRTGILIHSGNYPKHTEGCILVGKDFGLKDANGVLAVTNSKLALRQLADLVTERTEFFVL